MTTPLSLDDLTPTEQEYVEGQIRACSQELQPGAYILPMLSRDTRGQLHLTINTIREIPRSSEQAVG